MTSADETFERHRDRLFGVAYRMTGSVADAQDVCQDAWLRWQRADTGAVVEPEAYLVRIVTRLAIDRAQRACVRRETYVGPWLPEPMVTDLTGDPEATAVLADSMTFAFLVLLDEMTPVERAVFLLHDVFGYPFADVAAGVDRSEGACRQIASRMRRRLEEHASELRRANDTDERALLEELISRTISGDLEGLMSLLAPDVVQFDDGGALRRAARRPIVGRDRVARLLLNLSKRIDPTMAIDVVRVNGVVGLAVRDVERIDLVMTFAFTPDRTVRRIFVQLNAEKLRHLNPM